MPTHSEQAFLAIFNLLTVDDLKPRFKSCPAAGTAPARKAELVSAMKTWLAGNGLELVWQSLTELEQQAVCTSLYCNDGWFDERRFATEIGAVPAWFTEQYYHFNTPAERYRLGCFFYPPGHRQSDQRIPGWLQERLTTLVSPPPPVQLPAEEVPEPLPGKAVVVREQAATRELWLLCRDEPTAAAVAVHPLTAGLCLFTGENRLLIEPRREPDFRRALHQAGYGLVAG